MANQCPKTEQTNTRIQRITTQRSRNLCSEQCQGRETWTGNFVLLPHLHQLLSQYWRKKSPHASGSGRGKGTIWKHARALLASLSTGETDQNLTYRVVWPEPNWPGGGETPSSMLATLSHPTYQGRKTNWEVHVKWSSQSSSLKEWDLFTGLQNSFPTPTSHHAWHYWRPIHSSSFYLVHHVQSPRTITRYTKRQKTVQWGSQHQKQICTELSDQVLKISIVC